MTVHSNIRKEGGCGMLKEMFTSMHELLDYITVHFESADDDEREQYCLQLQQLKENNDLCLDQWISFEDKLTHFFDEYQDVVELETESYYGQLQMNHDAAATVPTACNECDLYTPEAAQTLLDHAQGYYKLFMFHEAARLLHTILEIGPECNMARLYYGMTLLHLQNWNEAQRQFQLLTVLSDYPKWLALSYNALGCIHAIKLNMNEAETLFRKAYQIYPQFEDSLKNLQSCIEMPEQLSLYFGSTELCCM